MFDIGFSEVLLIFVIALVVLGPEKLPRLASQVGRWVGRARAMARQFREQLEEEVNLEQVRKAHEAKPSQPPGTAETGTPRIEGTQGEGQQPPASGASSSATGSTDAQMPDPVDFRADTFSHAHPTNEYGANPLSPTGAAETPELQTAEATSGTPPPPPEAPRSDASVAAGSQNLADEAPRTGGGEAYAPAANATRTSASDAPASPTSGATTGATGPTTRPDNHGHS